MSDPSKPEVMPDDDRNTSAAQQDVEAFVEQLPVGEHVEEVEGESGAKVKRKGVFLLPSLITLGALFAGFYAIIASMTGRFEEAAIAIVVAGVLDGLDGRIARLTNSQSAFGAELDSLSDMVSFGVAPALITFNWGLSSLGRVGWAIAFLYVAGAALRLARFNTQIGKTDARYFTGLASPAAAAVVITMVWLLTNNGLAGSSMTREVAILGAIVVALAGVLMVTNIQYVSFKGLDFRGRVPFALLLVVPMLFAIVLLYPPLVLFGIALIYLVSGPSRYVWQKLRS